MTTGWDFASRLELEARLGRMESGQQLLAQNLEAGFQSLGKRIEALSEHVRVQNGRVGRLEQDVRTMQDAAIREQGVRLGKRALRRADYTIIGLMIAVGSMLVGAAGMMVK